MATKVLSRSIFTMNRSIQVTKQAFSRSYTSGSLSTTPSPPFSFFRQRPLFAVAANLVSHTSPTSSTVRCFSTRQTTSSLNDSSPNWSNRPPKETILLDGCDFEHWLVVLEKPEGDPTRDDIIDSYVKTLAQVVGSEEEARMKMYSVSTRHYYAFGALISEELSYKVKELPKVRWVLPDSYLDVRNKDYGGEPVINGVPVPYDPKYHEEWVRNNSRAMERNKRNDRPRNFDRSRNFERRQQTTRGPPPQGNMGGSPPQGNMGGLPSQGNMGGPPSQGNMGGPPPQGNMGGPPPQGNMGGGMPPPQGNIGGGMPPLQGNMGGSPPQGNMGGGMPPPHGNMGGPPPQGNMGGGMPPPQGNMGGPPPQWNTGGHPNARGMRTNNMGGPQQNYGGPPAQNYGAPVQNYSGAPVQGYGGAPNYGNMGGGSNGGQNFQQRNPPYIQGQQGYQNAGPPPMTNMGGGGGDGGFSYSQQQNMPGRDV